jgi:hypothetical protein
MMMEASSGCGSRCQRGIWTFLILWNATTVLLENFFTSKWTITASFYLISSNKQGHIKNIYFSPKPGDKEAFL